MVNKIRHGTPQRCAMSIILAPAPALALAPAPTLYWFYWSSFVTACPEYLREGPTGAVFVTTVQISLLGAGVGVPANNHPGVFVLGIQPAVPPCKGGLS